MPEFYTFDDFMKRRMESFTPSDQFMQRRMPFLTFDDFMARRMGMDIQSYKNLQGYEREDEDKRGIMQVLEQFGRGGLESATFGISPHLIGKEEPQGSAEKIARGLGSFAGFLVPYSVAAKGIGVAGKALGLTTKLIKGSKYAKELAIAGRMGRGAATLGTATAISDLPTAMSDPASMLKNAEEGAKLGAVFGAAGFLRIGEHKALSWMLRQAGGRAMMNAVGIYDPTTMSKENLAESIFTEAMHTFFLSHGITPGMILDGKTKTLDQKALLEMIDADTRDYNSRMEKGAPIDIKMTDFEKIPTQDASILDILHSVDDVSKINQKTVRQFNSMLRSGLGKKEVLRVTVDQETNKYKLVPHSNEMPSQDEFLMALNNYIRESLVEGKQVDQSIKVKVIGDPSKAKLPRPIEMAMKFWPSEKVNTEFLTMLDSTRFWAYDYKRRIIRPIIQLTGVPDAQEQKAKSSRIGATEILVRRGDFDKVKNRWSFMPVAKGSAVPAFEWDAKKMFSKHPDDALYRSLEREIAEMETQHPLLKDGTYIGVPPEALVEYETARTNLYNMYKRNVLLEEKANAKAEKEMGSGAKHKWVSIEQSLLDAERRLQLLYGIPKQDIPAGVLVDLNARLKRLSPAIDVEVMRASLMEPGALKVEQIPWIEQKIFDLEKLPVEDRIASMFDTLRQKYSLTHPPLSGKLAIKQRAVEALERLRRKSTLAKAILEAQGDTKPGSVVRQLLTVSRMQIWRDWNKFSNYIQNRTGIPLFDIGQKLRHAEGEKRIELGKKTEFLNKYVQMSAEDQANVYLYYRRLFSFKGVDDIPLTEMQKNYISDINSTMKELAPLIVEDRHQMWMDTVYYKEKAITGKKVVPEHKSFRTQDEPQVREFLYEGAEKWEASKLSGDRALYDQWIQDAIARNIGTVSEGVYLPEFVLKIDRANLQKDYEAVNIGATGRGHFKSRDIIQERFGKVDLVDSIVDSFRDTNLHVRLHAYINQVMNVKYIEPHVLALEKVVNMFPDAFKDAKPPGFGRKGVEAKTLSMLDYLRLYAHRMKGYPVKVGPLGEGMRSLQSLFFRSLVVRPFLIARNIPQRIVTAPHKSNVLDPNYLFQKRYQFNAMSERAKNAFHSTVSQLNIFKQDYLQLMQTEKMKDWPVIGPLIGLAERVGSLYSLSDESNRRYVYSKAYFRGKDIASDYLAGKISMDAMDRKLGIGKMESNNQRIFREFMEQGDAEGAAIHLAEWSDMNTNWWYKRTEKSLPEMTGEGESWTNLLTWSKSISQWLVDGGTGITDGFQMMRRFKRNSPEWKVGWQKMADGGGKIISLALCGGVANALLNTMSFQAYNKFQSYGTDMFMWEFGGVSLDIVKSFTDTAAGLITSVDGTPQERKTALENMSKMLDNTVIRQLVPFSKNMLAVVESFTGRSHISPVYEKWTKLIYGYPKQKTYVQRNLLEGVSHALFATDPNKSEDIRRFINNKMHEEQVKRTEKGPFQTYHEAAYGLYKYYNDMLMRYEPYQLKEDIVKRESIQRYKKFQSQQDYRDAQYQQDRQKYIWERE